MLPSTSYRFPTVLHKYVLYNPTDSRAAASACPDFGAYLDAVPAILSVCDKRNTRTVLGRLLSASAALIVVEFMIMIIMIKYAQPSDALLSAS